MSVTISTTNKPLNPRAQDLSPKGYNRASLYSGKALDFDGVNDSVDCGSIEVQSFSLVTNVYLDLLANTDTLAGNWDSSNGFMLYKNASNNMFVYINAAKVQTDISEYVGHWTQFVATYDGTTAKLYANGVLINSEAYSATITYSSGSTFKVGAYGNTPSGLLNGDVAGIKLFNTALTAAQVSDLYLNPEKIVPDGVANSALKLWLPMMEGAGTTAYDGSGNGNNGTISGATWVSGVGAPVAQTALVGWNKTTNLLLQSNTFNVTWTTANSSITSGQAGYDGTNAWKIDISGAGGRIYQSVSQSGVSTYSIYAKAGSLNWIILSSNIVDASFDLSNGVKGTLVGGISSSIESVGGGWYRCSASLNGSLTQVRVYPSNADNDFTSTSGNIYIQDAQLTATSDVQPYVETFATAQTSPVLLPQGLTASKDIFGNSVSRNAYALNLDGASWAEVHDNASLDITDAITLEAWVYWDGTSAKGIFGRWDLVNNKRSYLLYTSTPARFNFFVSSNGTLNTNQQNNTDISTGWNHIIGVYDGTNIITYLNGSADGSKAYSSDIYATDVDIEIGRYDLNSANAYPNDIALPRIYNRALTATEISRNYNADKSKFGL